MAIRLNAGVVTLVRQCGERQALIRIVGEAHPYDHSLALQRVEGSRRVVADADATLTIDDMAVVGAIPLVAGRACPLEGRPFRSDPISTMPGWRR